MSPIDDFLLEAAREVDALYPHTPPIAPAVEDRLRSELFVEAMRRRGAVSADEFIAVAKRVGTHEDVRIWRRMYRASDGCPQEVHDDGKCLRGLAVGR